MPTIVLKPGREKSLLRRHPWIFSGAVQQVAGEPVSGGTVDLLSSDWQLLARASYSPNSQIRARVWTFEDEPVDMEFFRKRIRSAMDARQMLKIESKSNASRLIYAESDGIPPGAEGARRRCHCFGCSTGAGVELGTVAPVGAAGAALLPAGGVV